MFERGETLLTDALLALGYTFYDSSKTERDILPLKGLNTLAWSRVENVDISKSLRSNIDKPSQYALVSDNEGVIMKPSGKASVKEVTKGVFQLSNDEYVVEMSSGVITSLYDLVNKREVIPKGGKANQLVIFDDKPLYWQAWDVEVFHLETRKELHASKTFIAESGPSRVSVVTETKISAKSWIITTVSLSAGHRGSPSYVQIESEVEWRENMKFLKVEFPVDIRNTEASYETQYGIVRRPTHYNTSWDMAKFEVCCHKWADLSEHDYGVSVLNDSKYGFATCGNLMRLSLLRAPKAPDAHADMGRHYIKYAILPHQGSVGSTTVRTAFNFNNPLRLIAPISPEEARLGDNMLSSIKFTGDESLILDTIKRGEDDEDVSRGELAVREGRSIIIRIYDSLGGRSRGTLETKLEVKKAWKTNLLEDDQEPVKIKQIGSSYTIDVELRPFEVGTWRLQL